MTKRWTRRPDGSTWGDWGDNDELGRINLLTPEKVLEGVREVEAGISFCLSLPLDYPGGTALNQRRHPPVLAPTEDMEGNPAVFYNVHMSEMEKWGDPKYVDVWADDQVTLSLQYSTQWDSLAHVGAEFDADGDGVEEAVYYNGYRAGVDLVGPKPDAAGDGSDHRCFAHHLGLEHMAFHGVQGRGVLVDLAHHLGHDWRGVDRETLEEIMAADNVVVEPGDMLLLHTGFATKVLEWNRNPGSREDPHDVHLPRRPRPVAARVDRRLADLGAGRRQLRGRGAARQGPRRRAGTRFCRSTTSACSSSASRSARCGTCTSWPTWLREHGRSRFLLTAPPLRLPGIVGSPLTPIATSDRRPDHAAGVLGARRGR